MTAIEDIKEYTDVLCMACSDATCNFQPVALKRRALGEFNVKIEMKCCGICHTDVHVAHGVMNNLLGTGRCPSSYLQEAKLHLPPYCLSISSI